MAVLDYLKPMILAGGFLFILTGMNILIAEHPEYDAALGALYGLVLYTFYLYLILVFVWMLALVLEFALPKKKGI